MNKGIYVGLLGVVLLFQPVEMLQRILSMNLH